MGTLHEAQPVKLFVGMLAAKAEWLDEARAQLARRFGPVDLASDAWDFIWTDYYRDEMGERLLRQFVAFERLIAPDAIAGIKRETNDVESDFARRIEGGPARPVNLDPGYVDLPKIVLATTKNFSHRVCLGGGIYAEVTLQYHHERYEPQPWTYPDYRTEEYGAFFLAARERLRHNRRSRRPGA